MCPTDARSELVTAGFDRKRREGWFVLVSLTGFARAGRMAFFGRIGNPCRLAGVLRGHFEKAVSEIYGP